MSDRTRTVREVCDRYGVNEHTVLWWIRSGELRAFNVGRRPGARKPRWRITTEALEAFEAMRMVTPAPTPRRRRGRKPDSEISFY